MTRLIAAGVDPRGISNEALELAKRFDDERRTIEKAIQGRPLAECGPLFLKLGKIHTDAQRPEGFDFLFLAADLVPDDPEPLVLLLKGITRPQDAIVRLHYLRRLARATRPGGRLVVSLPNEFTLPRRLAILAGRPGFGGHADPHVRHYDPGSARALFAAAGLDVLACRPDGLLPPRWQVLKALTEPLARLAPGLFALSSVFLLDPGALLV